MKYSYRLCSACEWPFRTTPGWVVLNGYGYMVALCWDAEDAERLVKWHNGSAA